MVITDECHHSAAFTHENVLRAVTAKYVYGMTATAKRMDGQVKKVFMQFGPIRHRYTAKERAEKQGIGHYVFPRFTRLLDVEGKVDRHISDYFDMVCKSEMRNMQIVADTVDCVKKGRTPMVMTKYREHAQRLYDALQGAADHVFLLQGGNSMKARAALREKMLAVGRDETMIVVAIGQYVGEGFNYPRLDTMLLAMPISFEGNVEQYAGRLNRDYDGKKDVIIFDYIDQHIPKLERMYHKRLRTYKKIGFEVCSEVVDKQVIANSIFDCSNYLEVFENDVRAISSKIVISSPSLSTHKVQRLLFLLRDKNVNAVVFTTTPGMYPEDGREHHTELIQQLQRSGVMVIEQEHCYERHAVIDDSLVWYGSMNLLSKEKEDDSLMRLESSVIAEELIGISSMENAAPK
jgi:superfamily II DNA or RNA helicase